MKRRLKQALQRRPTKIILKLRRPTEEKMKSKNEESEGKEKALKAKRNLDKKLRKMPVRLEDVNLLKKTGRKMKYANIRLPADPCCPPKPKMTNATHCISIFALGANMVLPEKLDLTSTFKVKGKRLDLELLCMQIMHLGAASIMRDITLKRK